MKKRGFTLVELLAVIAILAILVIIALPNVMKLFNRAKEQAFTTELKEIYKVAEQQWIADSMFNTQERVYVRTRSNVCEHTLDLTGRSELEYYIKINKSGEVVLYKATDGSYQYSYSGTGLKIEDIGPAIQISKIEDESQIISITCDGTTGGGGGNPTTTLANHLMAGSSGNITTNFLRTTIKKEDIGKITFTNSITGHTPNGTDCWDVSVDQDGTVLAWTSGTTGGKTNLTIGAYGTIYASTGKYLFSYLTYLKTIDGMQYFDTSHITDMSNMFDGCTNLESLDVSHFDTSNVTNMSSAFRGMVYFNGTLNLSNFNTSKVTDMSNLFYGNSSMKGVNLSTWDTSKVTNMSGLFAYCGDLEGLDISNFDTSKVTDMNHMFSGCSSLKIVDIHSFDTKNVTNMSDMFSDGYGIEKIVVSNKFVTTKVTNSNNMFFYCRTLVGGSGTEFSDAHIDASYAHIDGGTSNPGYFTSSILG